MLAYYWHLRWTDRIKGKVYAWRIPLLIVGAGLLFPVFIWSLEYHRSFWVGGFIMVYGGAGAVLMAGLTLNPARSPRWLRFTAWLGKHSYSVYLWHMIVREWLVGPVNRSLSAPLSAGTYFVFFFVSCWVIGVIMARLVEFPVLKLRNRWFPSLQT